MGTVETKIAERIPTKVDTDKLDATFGVPEIGTRITWEEIENVIGYERDTCRFKTIQAVWRKKLLSENNIYLNSIGLKQGLIAEDAKGRLSSSVKFVERGRKSIERGVMLATTTPKEQMDEEDEKTLMSLTSMSQSLLRLAITPKEVEPPDTEKQQCPSFPRKLKAI